MENNRNFAFVVTPGQGLKHKAQDILKTIHKHKKDNTDTVIANLSATLVMSGMLDRSIIVIARIMNDKDFEQLGEKLLRSGIEDNPRFDCTEIVHNPKKFEHDPIRLFTMYYDIDNTEFSKRVADAKNLLDIDLTEITKEYSNFNILVININEDYFISMYDKYYANINPEELIYDLANIAIDGIIPTYSIDLLSKSLNRSILSYNKYTMEIIASAITSLVTTRFDIGISLDKNEYEAKYSKYSITLRKCLEVIARAVSDKDVSWLNSGDIEACIGAVCGIGIASSCIPCIQANNEYIDDENLKQLLNSYYESVSELMQMTIDVVTNYIFCTEATTASEFYIGGIINSDDITRITLKIKEVKAKHKRMLKYSDVIGLNTPCDEMDDVDIGKTNWVLAGKLVLNIYENSK